MLPVAEVENMGQLVHIPVPLEFLNVFTLQLMHAPEPVVILKVPILHSVQDPPLGPVYPKLHMQLVIDCDAVNKVTEFDRH